MAELQALIGQSWRSLLLYPGGLTALVALLAVTPLLGGTWRSLRRYHTRDLPLGAALLLLLALLPLPQSTWPYSLDLLTLLLLLELLLWLPAAGRDGDPAQAAALLAPPLNVYPLLALALALLGQAAGSLVVREVNRSGGALHWLGLAAWAVTLPPLLHLGPWRAERPLDLLAALRRLAHLALLLAAALPAHDDTPIVAGLLGFAALLLPLAALDRWWRGRAERWIGWQPWLVAALVLLLVTISGQRLLARIG